MKTIILLFSLLFVACVDQAVEPLHVAEIIAITPNDGMPGECVFQLDIVIPYEAPGIDYIKDACGKYHVGQIIRF